MTYTPRYQEFRFESYDYDAAERVLRFQYSFDGEVRFTESMAFEPHGPYDTQAFDRAARLAFIIAGISYYKSQPTRALKMAGMAINAEQAEFFSTVYRDGLSQFVYENGLSPDDIGRFDADGDDASRAPTGYTGNGVSVMQSGGKDSLLLARMLQRNDHDFTALYMQQADNYPRVIDALNVPLRRFRRQIDREALALEAQHGGLNGHVPVTFITLAYSLLDTILSNGSTVLAAIGQEGEEPHAYIGDYAVTHQWSKTWRAEQMFGDYVQHWVAPSLKVGSPLRGFSELKIAQLFVDYCWSDFGTSFSSCNVANYQQGHDNASLKWCGECPKCANSYLLFAAFVPATELTALFGRELFGADDMQQTFKGLLGIDGVMKPFECVGETSELRYAYGLSRKNGYPDVSFNVPTVDYDINAVGPSQDWARQMIQ